MEFRKIYVLIDPRNKKIRYVGQTNNIKRRYSTHISNLRANTHKVNWIKTLKSLGLTPDIAVIGEYTCDTIDVWEVFWINFYKQIGCNLTNIEYGGCKHKSLSKETKDKISKANKGRRSWNYGKKTPEDVKQKIKCNKRPYKWSESTRKKFIKSMTGRTLSEETKHKISEKHKGKIISDKTKDKMRNNNLGKKLSYDHRRKISESNKGKKRSNDMIISMRNSRPNKLKVNQYTLSGVFVKTWDSISDADRELNIANPNIVKCLKGIRKSAGGFVWKYHIDNNEEV